MRGGRTCSTQLTPFRGVFEHRCWGLEHPTSPSFPPPNPHRSSIAASTPRESNSEEALRPLVYVKLHTVNPRNTYRAIPTSGNTFRANQIDNRSGVISIYSKHLLCGRRADSIVNRRFLINECFYHSEGWALSRRSFSVIDLYEDLLERFFFLHSCFLY